MFLLYLGPETTIPILSALAAIVGFVMLMWNRLVVFLRRLFRRSAPTTAEPSVETVGEATLRAEEPADHER